MALVVSILFGGRALPIAWSVSRGDRGHVPEDAHKLLIERAAALLKRLQAAHQPHGLRPVILLGDAEFDGVETLTAIRAQGWYFVCRTGPNIIASEAMETREADDASQDRAEPAEPAEPADELRLAWLNLEPGDRIELENMNFTRQRFGPVLIVAVWEPAEKEPLYLVSNMDLLEEACFWYRRRFQIETLFSDHKSRGFHLGHSHLSDPMRLQRLLIGTCLAYVWMVSLGAAVVALNWLSCIHRKSRRDLSLFQIGLLWLDHCLNENWAVPVFFNLRPKQADIKSVR
jgi:hypothetical protein